MTKKMCPFLMMKHDEAFKCNCQEESCAWWDILAKDCAITVIAKLGLEGSFNAINKEIVK